MIKKQIPIGTCIQGAKFAQWAPALKDKGFECFAVCNHMKLDDLDGLVSQVRAVLDDSDIAVSSLGFYCNALQYEDHAQKLHACIDAAEKIGTNVVSTFAGGLEGESVDASMPQFKKVFGELVRHAEDKGVRLAIENCPMGGKWNSVTCNIGFCAPAWDMMFNEVNSPALGLEWEPAHQMYQLVDPLANLRRYVKKIIHIHAKDATVKHDMIAEKGIMCNESFVDFRFPGFGDTDWRKVFEILQANGYEGNMSIEGYHDFLFKGDWEYTGQIHALNYLKWCRGGNFRPAPWEE